MSAAAPIRVGLVGCGEIAQVMHLPILHELDAFTISGLCDLSQATLEHLAHRWGVPAMTTDFRELIASTTVDAVLVSTYDHAPVVAEAIAAGKHVLVEKPLAFTPEEGEELRAAADRSGVVAQLGYMKLFDQAVVAAVERLSRIERPMSVICHDFAGDFARHDPLYTQVRASDVPADTLAAGRAEVKARIEARLGSSHAGYAKLYTLLLMLGSHDLAILRTLFGTPERVSYATARGEEQLLAVLEYPGGLPCVLEVGVGTSYAWWDEWIAIHAAHESLRIEFPNPYVRYASTLLRRRETVDGAASERVVVTSHEDPFRAEWIEFARCVHGERETRAPLGGGVADLELALAIIAAMPPRSASEVD